MCDKMAFSAYILKIVEKDPFLRLEMRAKEILHLKDHFLSLLKPTSLHSSLRCMVPGLNSNSEETPDRTNNCVTHP